MSDVQKFNPLQPNHPLLKEEQVCPGCKLPFKVGDIVTLVTIGPGADKEEQELCREGKHYTAVAIPAHYTCVTGEEP